MASSERSDVIEPRWMVGIDADLMGMECVPGARPDHDERRRRRLLASRGEAGPDLRGDERLRAPRIRTKVRGRQDHRDRRPPPSGRPSCRWRICTEHLDAPQHQHDHVRWTGHDPDGARGVLGRSGALCRDRRVGVERVGGGPGTRANIDEFTSTTSRGIETIGGADRGKAIVSSLNPADPPMIMRRGAMRSPPTPILDAIAAAIHQREATSRSTLPGYRLLQDLRFDPPSVLNGGFARVSIFVEVEWAPETSCRRVRREPRHHDRRGYQGGRGDRQPKLAATAAVGKARVSDE